MSKEPLGKEQVDQYQIMRLLGRGGMGEVYLARDLVLGRLVALKIVAVDKLKSDDGKARFLEEARTTASFNHPNIVAIYGVGEHKGQPYVALEYLQGQTLRERLEEGMPAIKEAMRIVQSIAEALAEAHRHQVLHLDLKPENVMIPKDGRLRVVDFGLSRRLAQAPPPAQDAEHDPDTTTSQSGIWGTPAYIAPELWQKQKPTAAADIWALGIIAFEAASGKKPFLAGTLTEITEAVLSDAPLPKLTREDAERLHEEQEVPAAFVDLIARCLDKDPTERPSARTVANVLNEALSGHRRAGGEEQNPFRGLLAFSERHADHFFGRDAEVSLAVERLREAAMLAVVGVSGAGKSSFVQAGVVPRLRERAPWRVVSLRPGAKPFETLAQRMPVSGGTSSARTERLSTKTTLETMEIQAPGDSEALVRQQELAAELQAAPERLALHLWQLAEDLSQNVLLLVDQLEEVITLCDDEAMRVRFIEAICAAADDVEGKVRVVVTIRDDFLGRLGGGPRVRDAFSRVLVLQTPGEEALKDIITLPLAAAGYMLEEPTLADAIVAEVRGEPAALPLMQFALGVLWERRDRQHGVIRRKAYDAIGGVAGALATHADSVMVGWSAEELGFARVLLLRLVTPDGTRRVVGRKRLLSGLADGAASVLQRLIAARMLSLRQAREVEDEADVELAHESLVRSWRRLARWIDESKEELAFLHEADQAATLWDKRGRRPNEVWQGDALREAEKMQARGTALPPVCADFIAAGLKLQREQDRVQRQKRATEQAESARSALLRGDYVQARALVRSSLETDDTNLARALWWTLSQSALSWRRQFGAVLYEVAYAPDGATIAVGSLDTSVYLVDSETTSARVLRGHDANVITVAYAPNGKLLASGAWSGQVAIWDLETFTPRMLSGHAAMVTAVCFDAASGLLASGSADDTIRLWDARSGDARGVLNDHQAGVAGLAFGVKHGLLASAGADRTVRVWDPRLNICVRTITTPEGAVPRAVDWSTSGKTLCVGTTDGRLFFYDHQTGALRCEALAHRNAVSKVRVRGDRLASTGADQSARFFDVSGVDRGEAPELIGAASGTGTVFGASFHPSDELAATVSESTLSVWRLGRLATQERTGVHQGGVESVAFDPSGQTVASGATDWTIRLWSVVSGECTRVIAGHTAAVSSVVFDRTGARIASGGWDGSSRIWDRESGRELCTFRSGADRVLFVRFSPDERLLATANGDGCVRVYDVEQNRLALEIRAHASECRCVAFSPDGRTLASSSYQDRVVRLWKVKDGALQKELSGHASGVAGIAFSPNGRALVSTGFDRTVRVWDLHSGSARTLGEHDARGFKVAFDPNGEHIVSTSGDRTVRVWSKDGKARRFTGHLGDVNQAVFSANGDRIASGGDDMTVRVWRVSDGRACWRTVTLLAPDRDLLTHEGWQRLSARKGDLGISRALQARLEDRARFAVSDDHGAYVAVCTLDGQVELWARGGDAPLHASPFANAAAMLVHGSDVLVLGEGRVVLLKEGVKEIAHQATAIAPASDGWLVALPRRVVQLDRLGHIAFEAKTDVGVTGIAGAGGTVALGFENGFIDLVWLFGAVGHAPPFEDTPASAVVRLLFGPMHTLAAGFANGTVGIWSLDTGILLHKAQIHGPISTLLLDDARLIAASELGESLVIDLHVLEQDYRSIVAEVSREVRIRWSGGRAERL